MREDDLRQEFLDAGKGLRKGNQQTEANVDLVLESSQPCEWYELKLTSAVDIDQLERQKKAALAAAEKEREKGSASAEVAKHFLAVADPQADGYGAQRAGFKVKSLASLCNKWLPTQEAAVRIQDIQTAADNSVRIQQQRRLLKALKQHDSAMEGVDLGVTVEATAKGPPSITIVRRDAVPILWAPRHDAIAQIQFPNKSENPDSETLRTKIGIEVRGTVDVENYWAVEPYLFQHLMSSEEQFKGLQDSFEEGRTAYVKAWKEVAEKFLVAVERSLELATLEVAQRGGNQKIEMSHKKYTKGFRGSYQGLSLVPRAQDEFSDIDLLTAVVQALEAGVEAVKLA